MKKLIILLFLFLIPVCFSITYPEAITGQRVYDYSNILSQEQINNLQEKCLSMEGKSTYQVAVVVISSLEENSIEDYAYGLFNKWGIGQTTNNGLLILVSPQDREYRFETGYSTETAITDGEAGRIGRDCFVPNFRAGKYYEGIDCSLDQVSKLIFKEENINGTSDTQTNPVYNNLQNVNDISSVIPSMLLLVLFIGGIVFVFFLISNSFSGGSESPESSGSSYEKSYDDWAYPKVCPYCGVLLTLLLLKKDRHCPKCGKLVPRHKRKKEHHHNNYIFIPIGLGDNDSGSSGGYSGGSSGGSSGGGFGGGSSGGGGASGGW